MIIDITNEVYTNLKTALVGITVLPTYPESVPIFPCVTFEELTNTTNVNTIDTNGEEYSDVSFEINIFTNSTSKVTDAKAIRGQVDAIMSGQYRMTRGFGGQTPNFLDTNVYKYTLRYSCTLDKNKTIYRR